MNVDNFERLYMKLEELTFNMHRRDREFLLAKDTLKLLYLLCEDSPNPGAVLIPNLYHIDLATCVNNGIGYAAADTVKENVGRINSQCRVCKKEFLSSEIDIEFSNILLFPPFGTWRPSDGVPLYGRTEVLYFNKSLDCLPKNGRIVALLTQNMLSAPAFRELRTRVLRDFSLKAVFPINHISHSFLMTGSIVVIENTYRDEKVFMSYERGTAEEKFDWFKNGTGGFYVDFKDVSDRIDSYYFEPEKSTIRKLIQSKDTVKLSDVADVLRGAYVGGEKRKEQGDYLIITPVNLRGGQLHVVPDRNVFCNKEDLGKFPNAEKVVLKKGDVVVSLIDEINWDVYKGDENFAVVNQNVAIIRGHADMQDLLNMFFTTKTGVKHFNEQISLLSRCWGCNHISTNDLRSIAVPDKKILESSQRISREIDFETKVAELFRNLGWDVKQADYKSKYDISLFFNGRLHGIVEVKLYDSGKIANDKRLVCRLEQYKRELGEAKVYLFVDDSIFEYRCGNIVKLEELPNPIVSDIHTEIEKESAKEDREVIQDGVAQVLDAPVNMGVSDRVLLESIFSQVKDANKKLDTVLEKLDQLSKQISCCQSLVERQLQLAESPDEVERIMHAFSDECTERITREIASNNFNRNYNVELSKLVLAFGEDTWNKLEESSRGFLVTSKVTFNELIVCFERLSGLFWGLLVGNEGFRSRNGKEVFH